MCQECHSINNHVFSRVLYLTCIEYHAFSIEDAAVFSQVFKRVSVEIRVCLHAVFGSSLSTPLLIRVCGVPKKYIQ